MAGYGNMYPAATQPSAYSKSYDPDHVCKPVYIDAQGIKRPIIAYTTTPTPQSKTDNYISKVESVIQQRVQSPLASLGVHAAADLLKNRGQPEQKSSSSPFNPAKETIQEYFTRMQSENSLTKLGPSTNWSQTPKPKGYYGSDTATSNYNNLTNKEPQRLDVSSITEAGKNPTGGWVRPATWATQPSAQPNTSHYKPKYDMPSYSQSQRQGNNYTMGRSYQDYYRVEDYTVTGRARMSGPDYSLSKPTSDIYRSMDYPKEPAIIKPSVPDVSIYTNPVDNSNNASRYGSFNLLSRKPDNKYIPTPTIDSNEASRRYRGAALS